MQEVPGTDNATEFHWTIDYTWRVDAVSLPLLFQIWIWSPVMTNGAVWAGLGLVVGLNLVMKAFFGKSRIVFSKSGLLAVAMQKWPIPWAEVSTVEPVRVAGLQLPTLRLVFRNPVDLSRMLKKRKRAWLYVPGVPLQRVYAGLCHFLDEDQLDPRLARMDETPVTVWRCLPLLGLQCLVVGFWVLVVFRFRSGFQVRPQSLILLVGGMLGLLFLRPLLSPVLRWHGDPNPLAGLGAFFGQGSLPTLLVLFLLPFRSDPVYIVLMYVFLWLVVALEIVALLDVLRQLRSRIPRAAGLLAVLCFLAYPGPDLFWGLKHSRTVNVARENSFKITASGTVLEAEREGPSFDLAVLDDGRVGLLKVEPEGAGTLVFLNSDLSEHSTRTVPAGCGLRVYGDWFLWFSRSADGDERKCCFLEFGSRSAVGSCAWGENFSLLPAIVDPGNWAMLRIDLGEGRTSISEVDLRTGVRSEFVRIESPLAVAAWGPGRVAWASRETGQLVVREYTEGRGETVVQRIPAETIRAPVFTEDLGWVAYPARGRPGMTALVCTQDLQQWTVSERVGPKKGDLLVKGQTVACRPDRRHPYRLFHLAEGGKAMALPVGGAEIQGVELSPDGHWAVLSMETLFAVAPHVLLDLTSGEQRQLLLHRSAVFCPSGRTVSRWGGGMFCYLNLEMFATRVEIVQILPGSGGGVMFPKREWPPMVRVAGK